MIEYLEAQWAKFYAYITPTVTVDSLQNQFTSTVTALQDLQKSTLDAAASHRESAEAIIELAKGCEDEAARAAKLCKNIAKLTV